MCLAQRTDTGEAGTRGTSVLSQALYHWATALPNFKKLILKKKSEDYNENHENLYSKFHCLSEIWEFAPKYISH